MKKHIVIIGMFWLVLAGCKQNKSETEEVTENETTAVSDLDINYKELGMKYALATQGVLGKNLMGAIKEKGVIGAVEFCNIQAYPLTDSMSVAYNANIKRVTNKPRNVDNQVNSRELGYIRAFEKNIADNQEPQPILDETDKEVTFYYPITINSMCLQCHGTLNKEMDMEAYKNIKLLYPKDMAIGYQENDVRGLWRVTFNKE